MPWRVPCPEQEAKQRREPALSFSVTAIRNGKKKSVMAKKRQPPARGNQSVAARVKYLLSRFGAFDSADPPLTERQWNQFAMRNLLKYPIPAALERSWLVQRLSPAIPATPSRKPVVDPNRLAFGAGGGGLSPEARAALAGLCRIEYMGAAEFEYGAFPDALQYVCDHADEYTFFDCLVSSVPFYVIAPTKHREEVEARIRRLAIASDDGSYRSQLTKEATHLPRAVKVGQAKITGQELDWRDRTETVGWVDLCNGVIFGTDRGMMWGFANLLLDRQEGEE